MGEHWRPSLSIVVEASDVEPEVPFSPHHVLVDLLVLGELLHVFQVFPGLTAVVAHAQINNITDDHYHNGDAGVKEVVGSNDSDDQSTPPDEIGNENADVPRSWLLDGTIVFPHGRGEIHVSKVGMAALEIGMMVGILFVLKMLFQVLLLF